MSKFYQRPTGSKATALGERNRLRWSRHLRDRLTNFVAPMEFMAAEEGSKLDVIQRQQLAPQKIPLAGPTDVDHSPRSYRADGDP